MRLSAAITGVVVLSSSLGIAASFERAGAPKVVQITIDKATFAVTPAGIKVGDIVEWVNNDIFDHTTTSKAGAWDVVIPAGKKARVTMKKAGTFDYFCKFHPNMTGTATVKK